MAQSDEIKKLVAALGSDPTLMDRLSTAHTPQEAKQVLVQRGIFQAGDPPPNREQITMEMIALMQSQPATPQPGERAVEWVAAVGGFAGAAAAGFCAS